MTVWDAVDERVVNRFEAMHQRVNSAAVDTGLAEVAMMGRAIEEWTLYVHKDAIDRIHNPMHAEDATPRLPQYFDGEWCHGLDNATDLQLSIIDGGCQFAYR